MAAPNPTAAAYAAYPKTPEILQASITSLMPIRLDSSDYTVWKYLMTTIFKAHNLLAFIDGTITPPPKYLPDAGGQPTEAVSPAYQTWRQRDCCAQVVIHATLSSSTINLIVGCDTARKLGLKLEEDCSSLTSFHIAKFRSDLERSTKGSDSVHAYVQRIEETRDKLTGYDVVIDDAEMIVYALRGLPTEYNAFRARVAAKAEPMSLDGFYVMLLEEEAALLARNQYEFPQFADVQWSSNQCQICNEAGHIALVCPHRMDFTYQGVQNQ